jgi:hypothetical protein
MPHELAETGLFFVGTMKGGVDVRSRLRNLGGSGTGSGVLRPSELGIFFERPADFYQNRASLRFAVVVFTNDEDASRFKVQGSSVPIETYADPAIGTP